MGLPAVAQTAPQLYCQLVRCGVAGVDLVRVREACFLASQVTSGLLRGSGKPFICHLIGVASLLLESGRGGVDGVVAALLHAMFQDRVPFGRDQRERHARLLKAAGAEVVQLVSEYHAAGALHADVMWPTSGDAPADGSRQNVVRLLQLADELEDALDGGPWWHGSANDNGTRRGSAGDRCARLQSLSPLFEQSARWGAPSYAERWHAVQRQWQENQWPSELRSGWYSTFEINERAAP